MDRTKIINTLGLVPDGAFAISDMQMVEWGRDIVLTCDYRTVSMEGNPDDPISFQIVFRDCREVKYRIYAHISAHEEGHVSKFADIAELSLGKDGHRRDANILTTHFSVTISYGKLNLEMNDKVYSLA